MYVAHLVDWDRYGDQPVETGGSTRSPSEAASLPSIACESASSITRRRNYAHNLVMLLIFKMTRLYDGRKHVFDIVVGLDVEPVNLPTFQSEFDCSGGLGTVSARPPSCQ